MKHKRITIPVLLRYTYHETELLTGPLPADNPDELEMAQDPTDMEIEFPDGDIFPLNSGDDWEEIPAHIWVVGGFQVLGQNDAEALKLLLGPHRPEELEPREVQSG